jgi:peptidoglycan/xylan/chitin deacetylase (PgdA/CDA1 family)
MDGELNGHFVISLDFEIMWGVRDKVTPATYGENLRGVQQVIPKTLALFHKFGIEATFATVGLLFFENKKEMLSNLPRQVPNYSNKALSPYGNYLNQHVGENATEDPYHFAPHLVQFIKNVPNQEIGTHTFSHYYCLEEGQKVDDFREDILAAIAIAKKRNIEITSIVFPRNQFNEDYLQVCKECGILVVRNNQNSWLYKVTPGTGNDIVRKISRLMDNYINLTGYHCYSSQSLLSSVPIRLPGSRFLRPYTSRLRLLEKSRMKRIKNEMTYAAKNKLVYHLWWHPHNFGTNQDKNFKFLEEILLHYNDLNKRYGFNSITMSNLARKLLNKE